MDYFDIRIFESPPGEISKDGCWVGIEANWLYTADSREDLMKLITKEWRWDCHLAG